MNRIGSLTIVVASMLAGCGGSGPDLTSELIGHWASASCEAYPNGMGGMSYLKRDFTLTAPSSWKLTVTVYQDAACASPFVALDLGGGAFHVGAASTAVSGATEVDYDFVYRKVTPLDPNAVGLLNGGGCGDGHAAVGMQEDVTASGCTPLGLPAQSACPTEHDLNQIVGNQLFYGDRSGNLCQTRPAKLGAFAVTRN
jgi:hypothetical protein